MSMIYRRRSREGLFFALIFLLAAGLVFWFFWQAARNTFLDALIKARLYFFPEIAELSSSKEVLYLLHQIEDLRRDNRLLSLETQHKFRAVPARVVIAPNHFFLDALFIDVGLKEVGPGDIVYYNGIVLGQVAETADSWSRVNLISALGGVSSIRLGPQKELSLEALGMGGGEMMAEAPANLEVHTGDPAWFGGSPEFLAGLVEKIEVDARSPFQKIVIRAPVNTASVLRVWVLAL